MDDTFRVYPRVELGTAVEIGDYVILGNPPQGHTPGELKTSIGANAILRSHSVIYAGNQIGENFRTGHGVLIRESNTIGDDVSIGSHSIIEHHVTIEDNVRIHSNCFIPEYSVLKEGCWIGPCVVFTNARYPLSEGVKERLQGPVIHRGAKIGAGAVLLPGVVIGENALVGAGAVVVKDVPPRAVVAGNPSRILKMMNDIEEYRLDTDSAG
ncbi:MAG: transferase [Anaerolineae bacterium]|nr:transferase [Anaerolineae bacterium]